MLTETWRTLVRKYVVYDIPDEMAACFDCEATICPEEKYRACPIRLACLAAMQVPRRPPLPVRTADKLDR